MSTIQPYDAEEWTQYLTDKDFSVRASSLRRIQKALQSDKTSMKDLNRLIKADPLLCLHVVKAASILHAEKGSVVTGVEHAISSLGTDNLENLINGMKGTRLNAHSTADKMYFRATANSHHAAVQVRSWLERARKGMFTEESYLAALFYGIGHWALWHHAPLHMSQMQIKIREQGKDSETVERELFGCTIKDISHGLAVSWNLPELVQTSLAEDLPLNKRTLMKLHQRSLEDPRLRGEELRELNHLVQQRFFPVKLSNWLAGTATFGWHKPNTLHIIDIVSDYLKSELGATMALLHQNCAQSSRDYFVVGTLTPAAEMLFMPSNNNQGGYKLSETEYKYCSKHFLIPRPRKIQTAVASDSNLKDPALIATVNERFLQYPEDYQHPTEVLKDLLKVLIQGVGLERVSLNTVNTQNQIVKVIHSIGFSKDSPLNQSMHQIDAQSLFSRLYDKVACILVNQDNTHRISKMLPDSYKQHINDSNYLLMSVFMNSKPVAIVYADMGEDASLIETVQHKQFKQLCTAATSCLAALSKN